MSERTLIAYARIEAAKAKIEAMKIENLQRENGGESPAYPSSYFFDEANEIENAITEFHKNG
jgi:hypothetical protein